MLVANRDVHSDLVSITLDGVFAVFRIVTTDSVKGHSAFFDGLEHEMGNVCHAPTGFVEKS
jgi:hypothetical protein